MRNEKHHLVDKHDINFQCNSTMNGENVWWDRMCSSINMRIWSIYSFPLESAQIRSVNVICCLEIGCLHGTISQERKKPIDYLSSWWLHCDVLNATSLVSAHHLTPCILVGLSFYSVEHGPKVGVLRCEGVEWGLIKSPPAWFKLNSFVTFCV